MSARIPPLLSISDLPLAELCALRLDGVLTRVGSSFAAIDEPVGKERRAQALLAGTHERLIAERGTAAWVWGARLDPPAPVEFCVGLGARVTHSSAQGLTIREVVITEDDTDVVSGLTLTSPRRTIADLARFAERWSPDDATVVNRLLEIGGLQLSDVAIEFDRYKLPHKKRGLERLGLERLGLEPTGSASPS